MKDKPIPPEPRFEADRGSAIASGLLWGVVIALVIATGVLLSSAVLPIGGM